MESREIFEIFHFKHLAEYEKFELIESYSNSVQNVEDIDFLLDVVKFDLNPIIRHEASAQLLRIELKKPHLLNQCRDKVENCLIEIYYSDKSIVARHEAIEALSHVGRIKSISFLEMIEPIEEDIDIKKTIEISLGFLQNRKIKHPHLFESV